jgi:hypothetical protein
MKVKPATLFAIAGFFWLTAGINVAIVGIRAYTRLDLGALGWMLVIAGTVAIFLVFFMFIFRRYSARHTKRVTEMGEDRVPFWQFMNAKGYLMIIIMIALGAGLRLSHVVPEWFIAFFYVGLGCALALTGVRFLVYWRRS